MVFGKDQDPSEAGKKSIKARRSRAGKKNTSKQQSEKGKKSGRRKRVQWARQVYEETSEKSIETAVEHNRPQEAAHLSSAVLGFEDGKLTELERDALFKSSRELSRSADRELRRELSHEEEKENMGATFVINLPEGMQIPPPTKPDEDVERED